MQQLLSLKEIFKNNKNTVPLHTYGDGYNNNNRKTVSPGEDVEKLEHSYTPGENVN